MSLEPELVYQTRIIFKKATKGEIIRGYKQLLDNFVYPIPKEIGDKFTEDTNKEFGGHGLNYSVLTEADEKYINDFVNRKVLNTTKAIYEQFSNKLKKKINLEKFINEYEIRHYLINCNTSIIYFCLRKHSNKEKRAILAHTLYIGIGEGGDEKTLQFCNLKEPMDIKEETLEEFANILDNNGRIISKIIELPYKSF